jgi:hypothetical protein
MYDYPTSEEIKPENLTRDTIARFVHWHIQPACNRVRHLDYLLRHAIDDQAVAALECERETAMNAVRDLRRLAEIALGRPLDVTIH